MSRYQFNLRQLLIAMVVIAGLLLLIRFAMRSQGLAVGLVVFALGAVVLVIINLIVIGFLRGCGTVFGLEPDSVEATSSRPANSSEKTAGS